MGDRRWKMVRGRHILTRSKKISNNMRTSSLSSNSRTSTPPSMEGKHSRLSALGRLFKPWKWKRKKKSDKFEQTSRTLERKISMRATKEDLIKKGVLLPDAEKEKSASLPQKEPINQNHTPQANGSVTKEENSVSYMQSGGFTDASQSISRTGSSENSTTTVSYKNNPFLSLPDLGEVSSGEGELFLSTLPDPPIPVNEIGPIPPPPMFCNPSPLVTVKFSSVQYENENEAIVVGQSDAAVDTSVVEEIPAKEPQLSAMPKKSALKKRYGLSSTLPSQVQTSTAANQNISDVTPLSSQNKIINCKLQSPVITVTSNHKYNSENKENRPVPFINNHLGDNYDNSGGDSDSDIDNPILWRDYYGNDEQCRLVAKLARKDSLAMKLSQRPDLQELIDKNIIHIQSEKERQESREAVENKLIRRLSLRPTAEELEQRNILKNQTPEEIKKEKEQKKKMLIRKLSFRPTIEELKERKIIRFNDYVEVTQAQDYDRRADKPWTRLTPRDKAAIRKELNEFKSMEMEVHADSRHLTRFHRP
ncbi:phosphatase and actin regulator 1-like isoform X2 [Centruroides vittatus]|uniref:phosphatase and actin regulator 1-like isoform X2 n=1 Tax=Centruroides vittatus TaxID=120091 RepID=UPI00350F5B92